MPIFPIFDTKSPSSPSLIKNHQVWPTQVPTEEMSQLKVCINDAGANRPKATMQTVSNRQRRKTLQNSLAVQGDKDGWGPLWEIPRKSLENTVFYHGSTVGFQWIIGWGFPNSVGPMVFSWCSRLGFLGIITHKYPLSNYPLIQPEAPKHWLSSPTWFFSGCVFFPTKDIGIFCCMKEIRKNQFMW